LRALELNPNSAWARDWFGFTLIMMGRFDEALVHLRKAVELEPRTALFYGDLGELYRFWRRYDEAIVQHRKGLEVDPNSWIVWVVLGRAYVDKGAYREGIAALEKARSLDPNPQLLAFLAQAHGLAGDRIEARRLLVELEKTPIVTPSFVALGYLGAGDHDRAFEWLEKSVSQREMFATFLKFDPSFDPLRSDPRFAALLKRIPIFQ
ncbi:MAG: tetratricopeptide repeat protein, partial [Bryobacteraceae bacterium]